MRLVFLGDLSIDWAFQAIGDFVPALPDVDCVLADLFRLAHVTVSPSEHDGTPKTLLEAMAFGCFPVVGDIESVQEWIEHGINDLLCDPASPEAQAIPASFE